MVRRVLVLACLALGCSTLGCPAAPVHQPPSPPSPALPEPPEPDAPPGDAGVKGPFKPATDAERDALVGANSGFAGALYGKLAAEQGGNFAFSPVSVSLALGMAYAGAAGDTAREMKQALGFSLDGDATHRGFGTLLRSWALPAGEKRSYELTVANRLFGSRAVSFLDSYVAATADHYQAPLEQLDFVKQAEASREHINAWVAERTHDRIKDILPSGSVTPSSGMILTNAIYFKGNWMYPFGQASPETFYMSGGTVKAPMMRRKRRFLFGETSEVKVLTLSYAESPIEMNVVLPKARDGLAAVEAGVAAGKLPEWLGGRKTANVDVALPRFTIAGAGVSLRPALEALGMAAPFSDARADFSGMAKPGGPKLFIADVFHKAFVAVDEKGTEAAAATAVLMEVTSIPPPVEEKEFIADHPFLFVIRDAHSGSILFLGRVSDPTKES
jgi:serpin B